MQLFQSLQNNEEEIKRLTRHALLQKACIFLDFIENKAPLYGIEAISFYYSSNEKLLGIDVGVKKPIEQIDSIKEDWENCVVEWNIKIMNQINAQGDELPSTQELTSLEEMKSIFAEKNHGIYSALQSAKSYYSTGRHSVNASLGYGQSQSMFMCHPYCNIASYVESLSKYLKEDPSDIMLELHAIQEKFDLDKIIKLPKKGKPVKEKKI